MITHQVFLFLREREGRLGSWFSYSWGRKREENLEKVFLFLGERGGRLRMLQDQVFHAEWRAKLLCFLSEIHLWHCEEAAFAPYPITRLYTFFLLSMRVSAFISLALVVVLVLHTYSIIRYQVKYEHFAQHLYRLFIHIEHLHKTVHFHYHSYYIIILLLL